MLHVSYVYRKEFNGKTYQYGTLSLGKYTILLLVLFPAGTFSYTPLFSDTEHYFPIHRMVDARGRLADVAPHQTRDGARNTFIYRREGT